jgi:hypothetical protein
VGLRVWRPEQLEQVSQPSIGWRRKGDRAPGLSFPSRHGLIARDVSLEVTQQCEPDGGFPQQCSHKYQPSHSSIHNGLKSE